MKRCGKEKRGRLYTARYYSLRHDTGLIPFTPLTFTPSHCVSFAENERLGACTCGKLIDNVLMTGVRIQFADRIQNLMRWRLYLMNTVTEVRPQLRHIGETISMYCVWRKRSLQDLKGFATLRPSGKQYIACHGKAFKYVWTYTSKIPYTEGCVVHVQYLSLNPLVSRAYR